MPHVEIHCFSGRTDEQKTLCAEKIAEVIAALNIAAHICKYTGRYKMGS